MEYAFFLVAILASAIMHEYAHGWMANQLGDPTAKLAGRLTLNPVSHIDPIGTILLPFILFINGIYTGNRFLFGWAKPVPFNPYNLKFQRWGPAIVGAAGPLTNFLIALVFAVIIRSTSFLSNDLVVFLGIVVFANIILGVFNLFPIPPLDGSKVLFAILPSSWLNIQYFLERYALFIFLFFIFLGRGIISAIIIYISIIILGYDNTILVVEAVFL